MNAGQAEGRAVDARQLQTVEKPFPEATYTACFKRKQKLFTPGVAGRPLRWRAGLLSGGQHTALRAVWHQSLHHATHQYGNGELLPALVNLGSAQPQCAGLRCGLSQRLLYYFSWWILGNFGTGPHKPPAFASGISRIPVPKW